MSIAEPSLNDARANGASRYFTGKACSRGHVAERMVSNRQCVACLSAKRDKLRNRPDQRIEAAERTAAWRLANPERNAENMREWRKANRPKQLELERRWNRENIGRKRAKDARARAAVRRATPLWSEREQIAAFYHACPPGYQVDHDIPLRGRLVCGLHVLGNLQYLSASENASKGNRWLSEEA